MTRFLSSLLLVLMCAPLLAEGLSVEARIERAMQDGHRSAENIARNRYRHPVGTLTFLGLEDGMSVLEIWPGSGWYTEILAPVMKDHGQYSVASYDPAVAGQPEYRYANHQELVAKLAAHQDIYGPVNVVPYSPPESASLGEAGSYDLILTFRNTHGWISGGIAPQVFGEFARVLKPGGLLGIVQHRAADGTDPKVTAETGYVSEEAVIALARAAGLYLEASSEVNANPADTRDHEQGVWSLPPGLAVCEGITDAAQKTECEAPWLAIGESDRMTLRFRKPLR